MGIRRAGLSKWARGAFVLGALGSFFACSSLKPGEGTQADAGDASVAETSTPPPDLDAEAEDARPVATDSTTPDGGSPDAASEAGRDAALDSSVSDDPGPLEPLAGNLLAGLGISVSNEHVYWLEQGMRAGASSNFDAVFRRRALTAAPCTPATDNCGSWLPTAGRTYFGDAHTGPVSSDAMTCFSVIYNGTRDTDLHCLLHVSGTMTRVPGIQFAASVRFAVGTDLYFSVPSRSGGPATLKRWAAAATPSVAPVDVLSRTATAISDAAIDGDMLFWSESSGSGASATSSVWARQGAAGTPAQIAPPRTGTVHLAVDPGFVYVTHLADGKIDRHARTTGGAGAGVQIAMGQSGVGPILRRGAYLLWLNYGPAPDYTASTVVRAKPDGTGQVVLDDDAAISDLAATNDTAYMVTFGTDPAYNGTVKRVRFTR